MLLLINPPISIPSEAPLGIARLSGALLEYNIPHEILDANIEGIHWLLKNTDTPDDMWSKRSKKHLEENLLAIKNGSAFKDPSKYRKTVLEINRLIEVAGFKKGVRITLSDYTDNVLSPLMSMDLIASAKNFSKNLFFEYFSNRFEEIINQGRITIAGFSINYLSQVLCAFSMMGFLKDRHPYIKIIIGGGLINSWVKRGLKKKIFKGFIDEIIYGPGEKPLLSMFGINTDLKYFRPCYEKFNKELYLSPGFVLPYNTSTGCYWNRCTFCPEKAEGNEYIQFPREKVAKTLKDLVKKTQPSLIHLTDNALHPSVLDSIIKSPPDAPWYGFVRLDKYMEDMDYCIKLKQSGCILLKIGIESADQDVLNKMKKGIKIEKAEKILKNLKFAGIGTYLYFLFGTPFETYNSARKTMDFVVETSDFIDFMNIAIFNMPVNTRDANDLALKDFYDGDLSLYTDFIHPHGWNRMKVRRFLDKEFKKHPAIKAIMDRHPRFFTSNHAPFFIMVKQKFS